MKRLLVTLGLLAMLCMPAFAFVQSIDQFNGGVNASTSLMVHPFGDANGGNRFIDYSYYSHTLTPYWNATISNATSPYTNFTPSRTYNGTSIYFDGTYRSNISVSDGADLTFGDKNFTVDFWVYPLSDTGSKYIWESGYDQNGIQIFIRATYRVRIAAVNASSNVFNYQFPISSTPQGVWTHVAFERVGPTARGYINGVEVPLTPTVEFDQNVMPDLKDHRIGNANVSTNAFAGYLSEIRFSKNIARYPMASGPEIRTAPYNAWNDTTISGLYFKDTAVPNYSMRKNYTVYARNGTNWSYVNANISFDSKYTRATNVYFNNSQFNQMTAIINNATFPAFVSVNVSNQSWLASAPTTGIALFDVQFEWINGTSYGPANISINSNSLWNGNYTDANSGNYYFRDNADGNVRAYSIPPIANFTSNVTSGVVPFVVQFNDTSTNGPVTTWFWNFGGGMLSLEQNNTVYYTSPGTYHVNMTVNNTVGESFIVKDIVAYSTAPENLTAAFSATPLTAGVSEIVAFTDESLDSPSSWLWGFGDGINSTDQNPSHAYSTTGLKTVVLTVSNATASHSTTKAAYINVTATGGSGFTQQDIFMDPAYTLTLHITDKDTGTTILTDTVLDSLNNEYTTNNGTFYLTYNLSTIVIQVSSSGYDSLSTSFVMDADRTETIQLTKSGATPQKNTWYSPHQVRLEIINSYGDNLPGIVVNATANRTSMPSDYLTDLYGMSPDVANEMVNNTLIMSATTGSDGAVVYTMHGSISYDIRAKNPATGNEHLVMLMPLNDIYAIRLDTSTFLPNPDENVYSNLNGTALTFSEPNNSYVTLGLRYQDTAAKTTSLKFYVTFANNRSTLYSQNLGNPGAAVVYANYTMKNIRGARVIWNYSAVRT